jgi:hypothetical protein
VPHGGLLTVDAEGGDYAAGTGGVAGVVLHGDLEVG